ncbi:MAG TPA: Rieske 2Fe-2S domain-containing protein [Chloroflexota bacterium]|nr:Rieske 2Fe-2S domain-containing protein [Chloroflexota bacterium]
MAFQGNGEHPEDLDVDFVHTGPDTLAGRYIRLFWQPVYVSGELKPGTAKPIRLMSEDFTLYRGEGGTAHLVASRCAHRGTQLSSGWVEDDCIRCFYHGWKYDGTGQCVEQPAEEEGFARKVSIRAYPVREYLGLLFAYLGEGEPPPLPRYAELEADGLLEIDTYTRGCNFFTSLENTPDEVHVAFVHRSSAFTEHGLNFDLPTISAEETDYGFVQYGTRSNGKARVTHFYMPNSRYIKGSPDSVGEGWIDFVSFRVPVDDFSFKSFNVKLKHAARNGQQVTYLGDDSEEVQRIAEMILRGECHVDDFKDHPRVVNIQDSVSQIGQGVIPERMRERLGRSDVGVILLRRIWARELRALAAAGPLKAWSHPEDLVATSGV